MDSKVFCVKSSHHNDPLTIEKFIVENFPGIGCVDSSGYIDHKGREVFVLIEGKKSHYFLVHTMMIDTEKDIAHVMIVPTK